MRIAIFSLISFVISLVSMPIIIKICGKLDLYDYQDERKIHSGNISRLGGVGIVIGFIIATVLWLVLSDVKLKQSVLLLIAGFIIFIFALLDDIYTFPALVKLLAQLVACTIVTAGGFRFTQIFGWQMPAVIGIILTFGWILGVVNAYNLIDGLDGLCGSLSITAVTTIGFLYYFSGVDEAAICFILAAAILGFLCFNWPPAKIFMGDDGSQFLGFMIAILPFFSTGERSEVFEYNKFLIMIVLTAFPVFDTIAAIWRRLREKRPIMSADKSHLHHKMLNLGYSKKVALYIIAGLQILLCSAVILSYFLGQYKGLALLLESIAFMLVFFTVIHYTNRAVNRKNEEMAKNDEYKKE